MSKEAMKLALDFAIMHHTDAGYTEVRYAVQSALREALAEQPAQQHEPVAPSAYESLTHDMTTIAARQVPRGVPVAEFAMHALADAELREHDAAPQPAQQEPVGEWGDGRSDAKRILWKPGYVVAAKVGDKLYAAPQPAPVQQEPVTLMNNLALTIASYAISYRELVWNLSEKVMGVAMSAESVKGQANRVQVTAEAMSDLRSFVENGVTEKLAFWDKLFDRHKAAAWKLNAAPQPAQRKWVGLTDEEINDI